MNQHIPTQRPPQRTPQRAPQRQPQKPNSQKYGTAFIAILVSTVALLVISLIALCVALAVGGFGDDLPVADNPKGGNETKEPTQQTAPSVPTVKAKFLTLPCATKAGNTSYSAVDATDISGDTIVQSTAAALIDVTNGRAVATKNGNERVYPASMTKVMTLLVACENAKDPTALLTLTEAMVAKYKNSYTPPEKGPSLATNQWKAGLQVTVEDALFMAIYKSDTYACWLLADYIAGSEGAFVQMMNERAKALGLSETNTHFENCTGLYSENHYTTCFDMATIMAAAMNNDAAKKVLTSFDPYTADFYESGLKNGSVSMYSGWYTSRLEAYRYGAAAAHYAGNGSDIRLIAGKTGYETVPKFCFVTAGKNDVTGTLFVCVQVGGSNEKESTDDTREIYQNYAKY